MIPNERPLNEQILEAFDALPFQGITPEGFLIIAPNSLIDWTSVLMSGFYTMGAADASRRLIPELQTKDQILNEQQIVIDGLAGYAEGLTQSLLQANTTIVMQTLRIDDQEKDTAIWRRRFWISTGIAGALLTSITIAATVF